MTEIENRCLLVEEMSRCSGVSHDTLHRWICKKQIPGHKIGRLWKFRKEEIDEWVKSGLFTRGDKQADGTAVPDSQNPARGKK